MGSYRTKENAVAKISTSVYITNFPESVSAKELFHACKQYGHVVDSFIPTKRSKNGKRFGFVRFINVFNEERLVNNLCTIWVDSYMLHANIARFQRPPDKKEGDGVKKNNVFSSPKEYSKDNVNIGGGRVKEFASLANLKLALGNEGFVDITIKYMGELWVMLEFNSKETINKFRDNVSVASWFSQIIEAITDYKIEGRIAWVEVEGIPFKLWSGNTFSCTATKWGKLLDVDDQDEINSNDDDTDIHKSCDAGDNRDVEGVSETLFEDEGLVKSHVEGESIDKNVDKSEDPFDIYPLLNKNKPMDGSVNKSVSSLKYPPGFTPIDGNGKNSTPAEDGMVREDPFNIYPLLNKNKPMDGSVNKSGSSLKYPPGFTPIDGNGKNSTPAEDGMVRNVEEVRTGNTEENNDAFSDIRVNSYTKEAGTESLSSGHFKKSKLPRTGGSILGLLDEVVKVGQVMGYKMEGCISNMAEIIESQGVEDVNFLAVQETKMENMDSFCVTQCWGNLAFDHVHSDAVGNSGGILCIWDPNSLCKNNVTLSDYFVIIRGCWRLTGHNFLLITVYAPQDSRDKQSLWDYLQHEIGESHFTWCHKSATKMSKLDRFLVSKSLLSICPNINAITLERYISDHRPILLQENHYDYGPTPFRFFHHWLEMDGFCKLVEDTWKGSPCVGSNTMKIFTGKLKFLKNHIREWSKTGTVCRKNVKAQYKWELQAVDLIIDSGHGTEKEISTRADIINKIQRCDKLDSMEMAQKAKVKWPVEGDENSGFFHGMLNKKRSILDIRGVMVDGMWVDSSNKVKKEFPDHFSNRSCKPGERKATLQMEFPKQIHSDKKGNWRAR
nr:RNA-directed DNA polymerase, eukaryota [Tanacetum cinerariifolium]